MNRFALLSLIALLSLTACTSPTASIDADEPTTTDESFDLAALAKGATGSFGNILGTPAESCNESSFRPSIYPLYAGQKSDAGTVAISTDGDQLLVTFDTNETADLLEVHVNVYTDAASVPTKRPAPGRAPYKSENLYRDAYTVAIPLSDLLSPADVLCDQTFFVIAHAALTTDETGNEANAGETAYAGGIENPGKGAWFYVAQYGDFCGCVTEQCATVGDLLAGQYQDIGTMTISQDGTDLLVTYELDWTNPATGELYPLGELAIYVFTDTADLSGNRPTPGKAPYKVGLTELDGATSWTVRIPMAELGDSDTYYVVAKTTVNGETTYGGILDETGINVGGAKAWWYYLAFSPCN